jgi:putative transposase
VRSTSRRRGAECVCREAAQLEHPYLILDARYDKVREARGHCQPGRPCCGSGGRRQILAVELANHESRSSWRDFLSELKARSLAGVEFAVSDDHPGLKQAIPEVLPEATWQRCWSYGEKLVTA